MTKIQSDSFLLIFLLVASLIISYFIVLSNYKTIINNTNKITEAETTDTRGAENLSSINYVGFHDALENTNNEYAISMKGKILVTLYKEQQIGAAISMFSLQKWAKTVGATVVEPFVQNSTFTLPVVNSHQQLANHLRFRDYFDFDLYTNFSIARHVTPLLPWDDFVNQVPKKFIFVILLNRSFREKRPAYVDSDITKQRVCNAIFASFVENYDFYIKQFLKLKLVRRVCLSFYSTAMHINNFTSVIYGNFKSSDTLVWFYQWQGFARNTRAKVLQRYFYRSTAVPEILDMLQTSKKISDNSKRYINKFLGSEPGGYIAISIRKVLRAKHTPKINHTTFFHNCINELEQFVNGIRMTNQILFMSMDLGRFGDMSASSHMSHELIRYIKTRIFQVVYNSSLTMEQWEQSFVQATNGITDNGYIAAMQRTILENGKCLVMFGGSSNFQRSLLLQYEKKNMNETCTYKICYAP